MSAICGVFSKRSGPEEREEAISRMTESMKLIGPDSLNISKFDGVTLAHQALLVTPEEYSNTQPITLSDEGLSIVFDGRIYNRNELLAALKRKPPLNSPDALLTLFLYEQFGTAGFSKINGEFAACIFNHRRSEMLLIRDPIGLRTLYYTETIYYFAFATSPDAIATLPNLDRSFDAEGIASEILLTQDIRHGKSIRKSISSAPSAHIVRYSDREISIDRYYQFSNRLGTGNYSESESVEGLRYHLTRSVAERLRGIACSGSTLSGGIDSSGVSSIAAKYMESQQATLHLLSATPSRISSDLAQEEIGHMKTVAREFPEAPHHMIASDETGPFTHLKRHVMDEDIPLGAFHHVLDSLATKASQLGAHTLLSGIGGDMIPSLKGQGLFLNQFTSFDLFRNGIHLKNSLARNRGLGRFLLREIALPILPEIFSNQVSKEKRIAQSIRQSILNKEFLREIEFETRLNDSNAIRFRTFRNELTKAAAVLDSGYLSHVPHQWNRRSGTELLYPLMDLQLIDFCLSLPGRHFNIGSSPRGLYREATKGIIPDSVRTRTTKGAFIPQFHASFRNERTMVEELLKEIGPHHEIWNYADLGNFNALLTKAFDDVNDYQLGSWNTSIQTHLFPPIAYALLLSMKT